MISAGDFRNGITLEIDGQVVQIMEFQHVKPGKGAAFVRTKLKNVINGGVVEGMKDAQPPPRPPYQNAVPLFSRTRIQNQTICWESNQEVS